MSNQLDIFNDEILMFLFAYNDKVITHKSMADKINNTYKNIVVFLFSMLSDSMDNSRKVFAYLTQIHKTAAKAGVVIDKNITF